MESALRFGQQDSADLLNSEPIQAEISGSAKKN
jgi:hypothetical protein